MFSHLKVGCHSVMIFLAVNYLMFVDLDSYHFTYMSLPEIWVNNGCLGRLGMHDAVNQLISYCLRR